MKGALVVLAAVGLHGAAYAETYQWVDSRGSTHYTHNIESVPKQYRTQPGKREELVINDPAVRAAMEKESKRVLAIREEALKKARERLRRKAEEARQKRLAEEKQRLAKEKESARKNEVQRAPGKREQFNKEKEPIQNLAEK